MEHVTVKIKNESPTLGFPEYASAGSDGVDLMACFDANKPITIYHQKINNSFKENEENLSTDFSQKEVIIPTIDHELTIKPGERALVPTGLKIALPIGWRFQIYGRSGLALKNGITLANSVGKIDSDYRGDVGVIIINHGFEPITIKHGMKIAQGSIEKSYSISWSLATELNLTSRGEGGFGSTGE